MGPFLLLAGDNEAVTVFSTAPTRVSRVGQINYRNSISL